MSKSRLRPGQIEGIVHRTDGGAEFHLLVVLKAHPDWLVTARYLVAKKRGSLDLAALTVEPNGSEWPLGGIPSTLLADISIPGLRRLLGLVSQREFYLPGESIGLVGDRLLEALAGVRAVNVSSPKTGRRRGPANVDERVIRATAFALQHEGKPKPNESAAKDPKLIRLGYDTPARVRDLKQAAARKGWLARPGQGRRGGYTLTPKGYNALEEAMP